MRRLLAAIVVVMSCAAAAEAKTWRVEAGQSAALAQAFAEARPEDTIRIERGRYELTQPLALRAARVEVRGGGADETILSGAGLSIEAPRARLEGFAIENAAGDAVSARQCDGLEVRGVRVSWSQPANAAGFRIAGCANVLIEQSVANQAGRAGFLLLGVRNAIVQENRARGGGVGLALVNVTAADVTANDLRGAAIGAAVFDTPALAQGGGVRLFANAVAENNGAATGFTDPALSAVPGGVGVLIMGARNAHVFENEIGSHNTANVLIMAYPGSSGGNAAFNPLARSVMIRDNRFGSAGQAPQGALAGIIPQGGAPDVIWDGADTYFSGAGPRSDIPRVVMRDNRSSRGGIGSFLNLGLSAAGSPFSEASASTSYPPLVDLAEPERVRLP